MLRPASTSTLFPYTTLFRSLVGGGTVCLGYTGHAMFLPNWFVRRRGLAVSIAFAGVGVGSIVLLPWLQALIDAHRSEEHTSELQSHSDLVCRLLLEKKKNKI